MAFFDELSKTLSDKGKEAAQKAKEAAGVLQMKAQIASEKSKLKELYGAVGVLYYKKHRDDEDNEFQDLFKEIGNVLTGEPMWRRWSRAFRLWKEPSYVQDAKSL